MLSVSIDQASFKELEAALGDLKSHLPRNLSTAVNRVAKSVRVEVAKVLGQKINLGLDSSIKDVAKPFAKAKTLKKAIGQRSKADPKKLKVTIGLWEGYPFNLKFFKGKEYVRKRRGKVVTQGVRYKTERGGGWSSRVDAFMPRKWRGTAYRRNGRKLIQQVGPSPGDFFESTGAATAGLRKARERLPIEVKRRIREVLLAQQGIIKLKTKGIK